MSYTTSYRWQGRTRASGKRTEGGRKVRTMSAGASIRHSLRDLEAEELHSTRQHSNEQIDTTRTKFNHSFVRGVDGEMRRGEDGDSVRSVLDEMDRMLDEVDTTVTRWVPVKDEDGRTIKDQEGKPVKEKKQVQSAIRSDASIAMESVIYLDPEYTGPSKDLLEPGNEEDLAKVIEILDAGVAEARRQTGEQNTLAYSYHFDEATPHVHFYWVPRDQQEINGPTRLVGAKSMGKYEERHDEMRHALMDVGYDTSLVRVSEGRNHSSVKDFKRLEDTRSAVEQQALSLIDKEDMIGNVMEIAEKRKANAVKREARASQLEEAAERLASGVRQREAALDERENELGDREQNLQTRENAVSSREEAAEGIPGRLSALKAREDALSAKEDEINEVWSKADETATEYLKEVQELTNKPKEFMEAAERRLDADLDNSPQWLIEETRDDIKTLSSGREVSMQDIYKTKRLNKLRSRNLGKDKIIEHISQTGTEFKEARSKTINRLRQNQAQRNQDRGRDNGLSL